MMRVRVLSSSPATGTTPKLLSSPLSHQARALGEFSGDSCRVTLNAPAPALPNSSPFWPQQLPAKAPHVLACLLQQHQTLVRLCYPSSES